MATALDSTTSAGRHRRRRAATAAGALLALGITTTAIGGVAAAEPAPVDGGTARIALPPGEVPNYIFPFLDWSHQSITNVALFQKLMFRPLYWAGDGDSPQINRDLSLAEPVAWSDDLATATVTLKDYAWADGTMLTPANVAFWMGLVQHAGGGWVGNSRGYYPDLVESVSYDETAGTVTFQLSAPVSPTWFESNILANTTPLPLAWDLEADDTPGACSSGDPALQAESCPKVHAYLTAQADDLASYATNPLWQVVDGPWRLDSFDASGNVRMVPNETYSGPVQPALDAIEFVPFTSEEAQFNVLRAGGDLSVGYVPTAMAPRAGDGFVPADNPLDGYEIVPRYTWGFNYLVLNQQSPTVGPLFRQQYFRQALQASVDQPGVIEVALKGYGVITNGPVPAQPANDLASATVVEQVQPYSVDDARQLMTDNGWELGSGAAVCVRPGSGEGECGEGIAEGATAEFALEYMSGSTSVSTMMEQLRSSAAEAGIVITLSEAPYNTVIATAVTCTEDDPICAWDAAHWGAGWTFLTSTYPTGEKLFGSSSGSNYSNYSDPEMDSLIAATVSSDDPAALSAYEQFAAEQFPVTYLPTPIELIAVASNLAGVAPASPLQTINPENWYFTES